MDDVEDEDGTQFSELKHASGIQKSLTRAIDALKLDLLRQRFDSEGSEEDVRRLKDLIDVKNLDSSWWQCLNPEVDWVLNAER